MNKNNWTYKKLGEVCVTSSGGTPSKSHKEYYDCGTIPWLRSGEVAQGLIYDTELCITELGLKKSSAKLFPVDTVVIAMYGATVGQVGLLKNEMATNQAVCGIFPNRYFSPLFLLYCLKSKKSIFLKDAVGGAQPNISQNLIKNTIVPIPPLAEQERIVAELDLLSSIIEKKKAQLKELDQLAQSIFYDMFGDPITNEKGWEVKAFEDTICNVVYTKKLQRKDYLENGLIPIISQEDEFISGYWNNVDDAFKVDSPVVIFGDHTRVIKYIDFSFVLGADGVKILKPINDINTRYFFSFLKNCNVPSLGYSRHYKLLKELFVPLPPLSLQQEFAKKVEAIEQQKSLIQQSIVEVQTMFDYTMDKYFG